MTKPLNVGNRKSVSSRVDPPLPSKLPDYFDNSRLRILFDRLAIDIWESIRIAYSQGLRISEDSFTDFLGLSIARSALNGIVIRRIGNREEATNGMDWEWWIGSSRRNNWCGVFIQTKKIYIPEKANSVATYKQLRRPFEQLDRLDEHARYHNAVPLYCFYNHVDKWLASSVESKCPRSAGDYRVVGCTFVPATDVRSVHDARGTSASFYRLHQSMHALPWRCLFEDQTENWEVEHKNGLAPEWDVGDQALPEHVQPLANKLDRRVSQVPLFLGSTHDSASIRHNFALLPKRILLIDVDQLELAIPND